MTIDRKRKKESERKKEKERGAEKSEQCRLKTEEQH